MGPIRIWSHVMRLKLVQNKPRKTQLDPPPHQNFQQVIVGDSKKFAISERQPMITLFEAGTLFEKVLRISLYVTDVTIAKLYVTYSFVNRGKWSKISSGKLSNIAPSVKFSNSEGGGEGGC